MINGKTGINIGRYWKDIIEKQKGRTHAVQ
jgi:hypothetical protein